MSSNLVGILGLLTIIAIVVTLFKSKTQPAIAFIVWPTILAIILVLMGRHSFEDIAEMISAGFKSTGPTAALFVFSVLYFGIMTDAGMFDVIIGKLMTFVGDNVIGVCIVTCIIALVGHLDGGGASTFCIVIPSMLPVFTRMHMRKTSLLRIAVLSMGVLNLMPWAGPTMRAASVLGIEAGSLWQTILPVQAFGIVLALAHAALTGIQEKARGAGLTGRLAKEEGEVEVKEAAANDANSDLKRPKLFIFNICLTLAVIVMLIWDVFPSYYPFMIGVAAVLMGVLTSSMGADGSVISAKTMELPPDALPSVVRCLANMVAGFMPPALGQHLPMVIGILSVPLALAFDTDSYFYGMLPVVIGIGQAFGVEALPIAIAMVVCRNCATFISPMVPATLLGTGLAEVDIKDHIKASFLYVWGFSILCMVFAAICGIMPL